MKWIGQHIWDFISRFRSDVYLEAVESGTIASGGNLGLDSNNKIVKEADTGITDLHGAGVDGSADQLLTDNGDGTVTSESGLTWSGSLLSMSSAASNSPLFYITNTNTDANPPWVIFFKDATGADNDKIGKFVFRGKNDAGTNQHFAEIVGSIADATDGQEAGKLELKVCEYDGSGSVLSTTTGLTLDGDTNADGEIDVTIGAGAASTTTIAGTLTMGSTAFVNNSGVVQVATQGTIDHDSLANFVANEHIDWTGDVSASSVVHTNNITDLHGAGVDGSANQILTDDGDGTVTSEANFTFDGEDLMITSATNQKPIVTIKSTTNSNKGSSLVFVSDKGAAGADDDYIGNIYFYGDNDAQEQILFSAIQGRVVTAADTDEAGRLLFKVATSNGSAYSVTTGLDLFGHATTNDVDATIGSGIASDVTVAGNLTVTTGATIPSRKFTVTSDTHFEYQGDVLYHGTGATTQGNLYTLKHDGSWSGADADNVTLSSGLLAISLGTDPDVDGMLIRGMITFDSDMGTLGDKLYVSTTGGEITNTAPSSSGEVVRVIGYVLDSTDGQIWFGPDNSWVEIA